VPIYKNNRSRVPGDKGHLEAKQREKLNPHVKKTRVSKMKRQSLAAAAPPDADGFLYSLWLGSAVDVSFEIQLIV
jgi:hypothetical protein